MSWQFTPNAHVKIWKNGTLPPAPPAGAATYDGPAQILVPFGTAGALALRQRVILPYLALALSTTDLLDPAKQTWLQVIDDSTPGTWQWWKVIDLSPFSEQDPAFPGQYLVSNILLVCEASQ